MTKVLVVGGAGFIGSHIAEQRAKLGDDVIIYDNLSRGKLLGKEIDVIANVNYLRKYKNILFVEADILDRVFLEKHAKNAEIIFHTAAQTAVTTSLIHRRTDFSINALGTFNVLEAALKNDSTVIFTSTNKVYGDNVNELDLIEKATSYEFKNEIDREGIDEYFPIDHTGHSPYGSSKLAADIYVQDYYHTYGLRTAVFRMSCIYGLRQDGNQEQGWISHFVRSILANKPITIYGDGKQVRDVLFVDDLVNAFNLWLKSHIKHDVYNIGGGTENTLSLLELIKIIEESTRNVATCSYKDWRTSDQKVYISDITKVSRALNWKPTISPEEGVRRLIEESSSPEKAMHKL